MASSKRGKRPLTRPRAKTAAARTRFSPDDRREQILEAAIQQFAETGFEAGTREIAERLGVSQPLVYRYFPSKESLIKAVYERVYIDRWRAEWISLVTDSKVPLRERLIEFYNRYTGVVFAPEWIRIYVFSGLRGLEIHKWWLSFIEDHFLTTICAEVRQAFGLKNVRTLPIQPSEFEAYWHFHGGIFYYGMREQVYGSKPRVPLAEFIEHGIDSMLEGYPKILRRLLEPGAKAK